MKIKEIRRERRLSQQAFAEKINTSQAAVSFYETGRRCPKPNMLVKMAQVLNCTVDELLR